MIKRLFDIVVSMLLLLVLSPLVLVVSALIVWQDGFPVFYRQQRVGLGGRTFDMLKFRSMVKDADKIGGYQTNANDSRITSIGQWLRKTSVDELPQLINVLIGHMSLVGPRPDVPAQEANYTPEQWQMRNRVRPGITGLAQVNGRSHIDTETRTRFDLDYVEQHGLLLDLKILLRTFHASGAGF